MDNKVDVGLVVANSHLHGKLPRNLQFISITEWFEGDINHKFFAPLMYGTIPTEPKWLLRVGDPRATFIMADIPGILFDEDAPEPDDPEPNSVVIDQSTAEDAAMAHAMSAVWSGTLVILNRYGNTDDYMAPDPMDDYSPWTVHYIDGPDDIDPDQVVRGYLTGPGETAPGIVFYEDGTSFTVTAIRAEESMLAVPEYTYPLEFLSGVFYEDGVWYYMIAPF